VLVTGATGFIGRHLVQRLLARGCRVSCLVRAIAHGDVRVPAGVDQITGDVTDGDAIGRALERSQAEVVYHLAGVLKALRPNDFLPVNVGAVETLASACADRATPPVLVIVSSLAAAGPCADGVPHEEGAASAPVSAYGRSKLAGERAATRYAARVPISIVRPPIVFGPGDHGVLEMIQPIVQWGLHVVPGRGDTRVSLVHVADLVEALLLVAETGERLLADGPPGQGHYYMTTDDQPTYAELGKAIATAAGKPKLTVLHVPRPLLRLIGRCGDALGRSGSAPSG
jgi:nucleoside-diphosphate-sugar epimerase